MIVLYFILCMVTKVMGRFHPIPIRTPGRFRPIPFRSGHFGLISGVGRFGPISVGCLGPLYLIQFFYALQVFLASLD